MGKTRSAVPSLNSEAAESEAFETGVRLVGDSLTSVRRGVCCGSWSRPPRVRDRDLEREGCEKVGEEGTGDRLAVLGVRLVSSCGWDITAFQVELQLVWGVVLSAGAIRTTRVAVVLPSWKSHRAGND